MRCQDLAIASFEGILANAPYGAIHAKGADNAQKVWFPHLNEQVFPSSLTIHQTFHLSGRNPQIF